jgi:Mrp family chromosome partitioning ATPase
MTDHGSSVRASAPRPPLTPTQMEQRALIHRSSSARPEVDAFRELRTRLLAIGPEYRVVLVAPVSAGSGGSYVARNLAIAMAFDERRRAVLVDCDLRHPAQQAIFQVDPGNGGLVDYLADAGRDPSSLLHDSGIPRLQLVPAGAPRESSAEYFSTPRMQQLVEALRGLGPECHVFLDSPPVRGAPDARILSDLADVAVLVAGYGRDTPAAIAQAAANFDPGKFAGVVFNEGV